MSMPAGLVVAALCLTLLAISPAAGGSLSARVVASLGGPRLEINGRAVAPLVLFVNPTSGDWQAGLSTVRRAAAAGVDIVSFVDHNLPAAAPGREPDFASWDAKIDAILAANPRALLLPRFGLDNLPGWWVEQHRDDLMLYDNGDRGLPSMASAAWEEAAGQSLVLLVRHLEAKYGDHVLGYHPCGQHTGEWFYDRSWEARLAGFEAPMQEAFRRCVHDDTALVPTAEERRALGDSLFLDPIRQRRLIEFNTLQQAAMEQPLERFAHLIKRETGGRKLVVLFYGYIFELAGLPAGPAASGHLALGRLLDCPDVDIVCSPVSYGDRQPGGMGAFMSLVDSVQLHGKLWLNEDDTRTYLSSPDDPYGRAETLPQTLAVHDRNFAHIATRGAALWWMDLPGEGWLESSPIWDNCARLRRTYEAGMRSPRPYRPEVAVVVDEASLLHLAYGVQVSAPALSGFRQELYRMGAPLGFYLLSDVIAGKVPWPKLYIFLDAFALDDAQRRALLKQVRRPGKTALWVYAPGFVAGDRTGADLVSDLVGMTVTAESAPIPATAAIGKEARAALPGVRLQEFGPDAAYAPLFAVTDPQAWPLAHYTANGQVAAALKEQGGWQSVFLGPPRATASLLRAIARRAGVHIYLASDDIVAAGNSLVSVHATASGSKTLVLPEAGSLTDVHTGQVVLRRGRQYRFSMEAGETRLFRTQ